MKILFIINLYFFCYRLKLPESATVEASIESVLSPFSSDPQLALIKSFLLPALEEIPAHPDLFTNWRSLNELLLYLLKAMKRKMNHCQHDLRLQLSRLVDYCLANDLYEFL